MITHLGLDATSSHFLGDYRMRPDYGIDAPLALRNLAVGGGACILAALLLGGGSGLYPVLLAGGLLLWAVAGTRYWASRFGKLRMREPMVESLRLDGDERILDLGCGRGYLLIAIAKCLPKGRAVGVDPWTRFDRKGTLYNARAEQVEERIELHTADLHTLPFEDRSFDGVVSAWSLRSLASSEDRARAVREAVRVLKPGGMLLIVEGGWPGRYQEVLRLAGMVDVFVSEPNFTFVTPSWRVTARKPL